MFFSGYLPSRIAFDIDGPFAAQIPAREMSAPAFAAFNYATVSRGAAHRLMQFAATGKGVHLHQNRRTRKHAYPHLCVNCQQAFVAQRTD